jgi:hypothetical protein
MNAFYRICRRFFHGDDDINNTLAIISLQLTAYWSKSHFGKKYRKTWVKRPSREPGRARTESPGGPGRDRRDRSREPGRARESPRESPESPVVGFPNQVNKFVPSAGSGRSAGSAQSGCKLQVYKWQDLRKWYHDANQQANGSVMNAFYRSCRRFFHGDDDINNTLAIISLQLTAYWSKSHFGKKYRKTWVKRPSREPGRARTESPVGPGRDRRDRSREPGRARESPRESPESPEVYMFKK